MPRLDQYQPGVNYPVEGAFSPSSPALATAPGALEGFHTLTTALVGAARQVSAQEAQMRYTQRLQDDQSAAKLILLDTQQAVADNEAQITRGLMETQTDPVTGATTPVLRPLDALDAHRAFINTQIIEANKRAASYSPGVQHYVLQALRPVVLGDRYRAFEAGLLSQQKAANILTNQTRIDGFLTSALAAKTEAEAEQLLALSSGVYDASVLNGMTPTDATRHRFEDRETVFAGRLRGFVQKAPLEWLAFSEGKAPLPDALAHKPYTRFLNDPKTRQMLDEAARETLSTRRALHEEEYQTDIRLHEATSDRNFKDFMGNMLAPDEAKRTSPAKALELLSDAHFQARFKGSDYNTLVQFAESLKEKATRDVPTNWDTYIDLLGRVLSGEITNPTYLLTYKRSLAEPELRYLLSTLHTRDTELTTDFKARFREGLSYIDSRLKGVTVFGGAQNQEVISQVKKQYTRWFDEQVRVRHQRDVDVYGEAARYADEAFLRTGPHVLSDLAAQRKVLRYQTPADAAKAAGKGEITLQEMMDTINTLRFLDEGEAQLREARKKGASSPAPGKPLYHQGE